MSVLTLENEAFKNFAYYGVLLLGKTLAMAIFTAVQRFTHHSFASPEDTKSLAGNDKEKQKAMLRPNESVERVSLLVSSRFLCCG